MAERQARRGVHPVLCTGHLPIELAIGVRLSAGLSLQASAGAAEVFHGLPCNRLRLFTSQAQ